MAVAGFGPPAGLMARRPGPRAARAARRVGEHAAVLTALALVAALLLPSAEDAGDFTQRHADGHARHTESRLTESIHSLEGPCGRFAALHSYSHKERSTLQDGHGKVALVTGAAGFIGSHVARHCKELGMTVIAVDDLSGGFLSNVPDGVTFVKGDLKDLAFVDSLFQQHSFDYVYHLAAYAAEGLSHFIRSYNYRNNLVATIGLINAAVRNGSVKCFVFTSSIAVYGAGQVPFDESTVPVPEDPYGISKYASELDLRAAREMFGLDFIIVRPHNVYGPGQNMFDKYRNVIGIFMNQLNSGKPLSVFGDGTQTRKFSYVDDVARPLAQSALAPWAYNQVFNVGADVPYSVNRLADVTKRAWGRPDLEVQHLDARLEVHNAESKHSKLHCFFPHLPPPVKLEEGIQLMVDWAKTKGMSFSPVEFKSVEVRRNMPPSWVTASLKEVPSVEHNADDNVVEMALSGGEVLHTVGEVAVPQKRFVCPGRGSSSMADLTDKYGLREVLGMSPDGAKLLYDADQFQRELCDMQFNKHSSKFLVLAVEGTSDKTHCGIGCRFLRQSSAMWSGLHHGKTVLSAGKEVWTYTSAERCPGRNNECYFLPISNALDKAGVVDPKAAAVLASTTIPSGLTEMAEKTLRANDVDIFERKDLDPFRAKDSFGLPWLHDHPTTKGKSGCWVMAQLMWYLVQPNAMLEELLAAEKKRMGWGKGRCIAMHVRHGPRARFNQDIGIDDYVKAAKRLPDVKNILIMTEDEKVIAEAESKYPEYKWLYTEYNRINPHDMGVEMEKGAVDPTAEAINALKNLLLSSECDMFIGRANSTWFRLMVMLAYGRYGFMPPFENVREDWGRGGLRKWGFFGTCTLTELRKELIVAKKRYPDLIKMNLKNVY